MSSTPANRQAPAGKSGRRRFGLRDARIRSKLSLLLVVPVLAILALSAAQLYTSTQQALSARQIATLATLSTDIAATTHEMQKERLDAELVLGKQNIYVNADGTGPTAHDIYVAQVKSTDTAAHTYTVDRAKLNGIPTNVSNRLTRIDAQLGTLDDIRQTVAAKNSTMTADASMVRYTGIVNDLVAYHSELSQLAGTTGLGDQLRANSAFAQAKAAAADEGAVAVEALLPQGVDNTVSVAPESFNAFTGTLTAQQSALEAFDLAANSTQASIENSVVTGDIVQFADQAGQAFSRSATSGVVSVRAPQMAQALGGMVDALRFAEQKLESNVVQTAQARETTVIRQVVIESTLVFLVLVIAVLLAVIIARGMARSLFMLREGALAVAGRDLPEAVARLRDVRDIGENSPEEIARQVRDPIKIDTRDEIGQVAQAFNVVHREAVRVAAEQAALRTSVSAMFLNLARRSQALVDRMIGELDTIERTEEDPKRLAQLFQLDHLATRMRRNDENLLVLAGADSSAPRRDDALLADVLRAAQSEIELYNRLEFGTVDPDVSITAAAVNDVVRLSAELFDNATRFSPPESTVVADARRIGDYVLVQVEDRGLGMSHQQMQALNERLASPPTVDVAAFRMMGLAVVGRLASRYGIKVELRPNPDGGTVTNLHLPSSILILPRLRGREPVITRPRSPLAVERGPSGGNGANGVNSGGWPMPQLPGLAAAGTRSGVITASRGDFEIPVPAAQPSQSPPTMASPTMVPSAAPPQAPSWAPAPQTVDALGYPTGTRAKVNGDDTAELPIYRAMEAVWFRSHSQSEPGPSLPAGPPPGPIGMNAMAAGSGATAGSTMATPTAAATAGGPSTGAGLGYANSGGTQTNNNGRSSTGGYANVGRNAGGSTGSMPPVGAPPYVPPAAPPPPPPPQAPPLQTRRPSMPEEGWQTAADDGWKAAAAASEPVAAGTTRSGLPKRVPAAQLVPGGVDTRQQNRSRRSPDEVRGLLSAYHRGVQRGRSNSDGQSNPASWPTTEESE
jgi:signal transduction histidine kinase